MKTSKNKFNLIPKRAKGVKAIVYDNFCIIYNSKDIKLNDDHHVIRLENNSKDVWIYIDGTRSVEKIAKALTEILNVPTSKLKLPILKICLNLEKKGILKLI